MFTYKLKSTRIFKKMSTKKQLGLQLKSLFSLFQNTFGCLYSISESLLSEADSSPSSSWSLLSLSTAWFEQLLQAQAWVQASECLRQEQLALAQPLFLHEHCTKSDTTGGMEGSSVHWNDKEPLSWDVHPCEKAGGAEMYWLRQRRRIPAWYAALVACSIKESRVGGKRQLLFICLKTAYLRLSTSHSAFLP